MRAEIRKRDPVDVVAVVEHVYEDFEGDHEFGGAEELMHRIRAALSPPKPVTLAEIRDGEWCIVGQDIWPAIRGRDITPLQSCGVSRCFPEGWSWNVPEPLTRPVTRLREVGARFDPDAPDGQKAVVILEEW